MWHIRVSCGPYTHYKNTAHMVGKRAPQLGSFWGSTRRFDLPGHAIHANEGGGGCPPTPGGKSPSWFTGTLGFPDADLCRFRRSPLRISPQYSVISPQKSANFAAEVCSIRLKHPADLCAILTEHGSTLRNQVSITLSICLSGGRSSARLPSMLVPGGEEGDDLDGAPPQSEGLRLRAARLTPSGRRPPANSPPTARPSPPRPEPCVRSCGYSTS